MRKCASIQPFLHQKNALPVPKAFGWRRASESSFVGAPVCVLGGSPSTWMKSGSFTDGSDAIARWESGWKTGRRSGGTHAVVPRSRQRTNAGKVKGASRKKIPHRGKILLDFKSPPESPPAPLWKRGGILRNVMALRRKIGRPKIRRAGRIKPMFPSVRGERACRPRESVPG